MLILLFLITDVHPTCVSLLQHTIHHVLSLVQPACFVLMCHMICYRFKWKFLFVIKMFSYGSTISFQISVSLIFKQGKVFSCHNFLKSWASITIFTNSIVLIVFHPLLLTVLDHMFAFLIGMESWTSCCSDVISLPSLRTGYFF